MSSEGDDPMGMQHLFHEQLSGDSATLSAATASDTAAAQRPWTAVLQLSLRCLIHWLQASSQALLGLQPQHLDAMLHLIAQRDRTSSIQQAAPASTTPVEALTHSSSSDSQTNVTDLLEALCNALIGLVQSDSFSWACDHIGGSVLVGPKRASVFGKDSSSCSGSVRTDVIQLAAVCLMSRAQACLAQGEDCQLVMDMWADIAGSVPWLTAGQTEADLVCQIAPPRYSLLLAYAACSRYHAVAWQVSEPVMLLTKWHDRIGGLLGKEVACLHIHTCSPSRSVSNQWTNTHTLVGLLQRLPALLTIQAFCGCWQTSTLFKAVALVNHFIRDDFAWIRHS